MIDAAGPAEPPLRLRPLGLGEILDEVFRVYRRHFWVLVSIALLVALPGLALQFASGSATQFGFVLSIVNDLNNPDALAARQPPGLPNLPVLALTYLVLIALIPFTLGAIPRASIDIVMGRPVSVGSTLAGVARRYWRLMGITLLYALVSPLAICLPVFVWLFVRWVVAIPAMLAEDVGPVTALDRSWTLTRNHWWRLFGILVLIYLLTSVVSGALGVFAFPVAVAVPFIPPTIRGAIILTAETAASAVVQPALYLCLTLLYFDLRIRREHYDLDQLARLAVPPVP